MIYVETRGNWREMGRQFGEELRQTLYRFIDGFVPWLRSDLPRVARTSSALREHIRSAECMEIIEESAGIAEGAQLSPDAMLCLRFLTELSQISAPSCSVVYLNDSDRGPVLSRNEDIEPDLSVEVQVCHTARPVDGPASMLITYAGLLMGVGMNDAGVAIGGTSAHAQFMDATPLGLPNSLIQYAALHRCARACDIGAWVGRRAFFGKPWVAIVADATGESFLLEVLPNQPVTLTPRKKTRDWHSCTNHYQTHCDLIRRDPLYLQSSYARAGRIAHRLADHPMDRTVRNVEELMSDIAMPGICVSPEGLKLRTAYTTSMLLEQRVLRLREGHPGDGGRIVEVKL
jgi:hypothetical protein